VWVLGEHDYFEQAADALSRAMVATHIGEQAVLLEEALRLNRYGLAQEKAKLAKLALVSSPTSDTPIAEPSRA
jgi:hypothetical protein